MNKNEAEEKQQFGSSSLAWTRCNCNCCRDAKNLRLALELFDNQVTIARIRLRLHFVDCL